MTNTPHGEGWAIPDPLRGHKGYEAYHYFEGVHCLCGRWGAPNGILDIINPRDLPLHKACARCLELKRLKNLAKDLAHFERDLMSAVDRFELVATDKHLVDRATAGGYRDSSRYIRVKTALDKLRDRITAELLGIEGEIKAAKP